ncbi:TonB-dependent receptor domain-containing protein [Rhizorhabdus dicambivorans]|uniref:TonB-dependent receptor n=1 Tax=Rhizorhabdus dicambivorans TaxID=1850238 RepID=A0A2A4FTL9_9SPHN|nr:TonB-dependent receptor [Rhizorhabdus dicambivorans]ATE66476.1 TonB-dependent receptor [Rhizorhabdus dicambivorans]PCE41032.1 TonB-dependent receptor [Rhizorhabdus dicambivorans]
MDISAPHAVNRPLAFAAITLTSLAAPSWAADIKALDLPRGRLSDAVSALAAQTGASVSVTDASIWSMRVAALKGPMDAGEALRRLVRGSRAGVVPLGGNSFRIYPLPARTVQRASPLPAAPVVEQGEAIIVVTASKRDTRLRDFAGSVSMLDGTDLGFGGEQGTESILARVASLSSTHLGAGRNKLFIRGIADSSFTGPTQATVGQYWGDMRLTYNAPDPDLRLYDIRSVEILEGPQGTLYGAGSLGGIIRVIRNAPDLDNSGASLSAGVSATQHGDPSGDLGGMINLPVIGGRVALRAVGYGITEGGYIDDVWRGKKDINRTRVAGGRAALRIDPGARWMVDVGGIFQNNHGRDSQYADRRLGGLKRASRAPGGFDADYALGELVVGKSWDGLSFMSSTGYARQRLDERYDASLPGGPDRQFSQRNLTNMFTSENRLWRPMRHGFGWVLGVSHTRNKTNIDRSYGAVDATTSVPGVTNRVRESTIFAEASVEPVRGLIATAGARYTRSRLTGGAEDPTPVGPDLSPRLAALIEQARAEIIAGRSEKRFLPSASLSATPIRRLTVYARYQEGFRPGGLAIESGYVRRFLNDKVRTMETGMRFGERGRDIFDLSLSLSHTRWTNIQADFIDASGLPSTDNIGDGRIYSLSMELGLRPASGLSLDIASTLNDSKVVDPSANLLAALDAPPINTETGARTGGQSRIPNVARFTVRIGADYRAALDETLELRVSGWARYVGKSRLGIGPILGDLQGDYFDTSLTARIGRPDFGVTLGVTNLTDAIGNRFALGTPFSVAGGGQITPLRPRTIRLGVDRSF